MAVRHCTSCSICFVCSYCEEEHKSCEGRNSEIGEGMHGIASSPVKSSLSACPQRRHQEAALPC